MHLLLQYIVSTAGREKLGVGIKWGLIDGALLSGLAYVAAAVVKQWAPRESQVNPALQAAKRGAADSSTVTTSPEK